jgi:glycogen debranching enzyme
MPDDTFLPFPDMKTADSAINRAYRIAMGDLVGNIRLFQDGLLDEPRPVLLAGLDYDTPWTRDTAINVWNGLSLVWPEVSKNTLLSVLERRQEKPLIGGQYWDAIIWAVGAWTHFLHTGDREFLAIAFNAIRNSLEYFEHEEFDSTMRLFRGPAVYGDGVAAYPDRYSPGGTSSILDWAKVNPEKKAPSGFGIPMMTLSTNCVYVRAYEIADLMALELDMKSGSNFKERAEALRKSIRKNFWNADLGTFNYLIDPEGVCEFQEGLGQAFAILFDIADDVQVASVLSHQYISPVGIPCVWPTFPRYTALGGFGRHSGTVWPFISGFWGEAALKGNRPDLFEREFDVLTTNINRANQCAEIHHPQTGQVYGGLQESGSGPNGMDWVSCSRQSWTATAYLRLLFNCLLGMKSSTKGIAFQPYLPVGTKHVQIHDLRYRACRLDVTVEGRGARIVECSRNGASSEPFLYADARGAQQIYLRLAD